MSPQLINPTLHPCGPHTYQVRVPAILHSSIQTHHIYFVDCKVHKCWFMIYFQSLWLNEIKSLYKRKSNGISWDRKRRNVLTIKSFLTQITHHDVEKGWFCTLYNVIISQVSSYVYISNQRAREKDTKFLKIYLVHSLSLRNYFLFQCNNVYFCATIFSRKFLIKECSKTFQHQHITGFLRDEREKLKENISIYSKSSA